MNLTSKAIVISSLIALNAIFNFSLAVNLPKSDHLLTQWVKITTTHFHDFTYQISVNNLDMSITHCGDDCSIVKLSTTPFTNGGTIHFNIRLKMDCGSRGSVDIPFNVSNDYLSTPITSYHIPVEGTYCVFTSVDAIISGSANKGYEINLIGANL